MNSGEKDRINLTIDREIKEKAKEKAIRLDESLSAIAENAFREYLKPNKEDIECPNNSCTAKYKYEALQNGVKDCAKCGTSLKSRFI